MTASVNSGCASPYLCPVNTFSICLNEIDCHLTLSNLEVSKASCRVIDRAGVELPGQWNTSLASGGRVADCPAPTDNIRVSIIFSDKLLEEERRTASDASVSYFYDLCMALHAVTHVTLWRGCFYVAECAVHTCISWSWPLTYTETLYFFRRGLSLLTKQDVGPWWPMDHTG